MADSVAQALDAAEELTGLVLAEGEQDPRAICEKAIDVEALLLTAKTDYASLDLTGWAGLIVAFLVGLAAGWWFL